MMIILDVGVLMLPLEELQFLKIVFISLITFFFIAKPVDDLGINENYLFHIKKSVVSGFTKVDKYKLSSVKSIRCGGIYSDKWELVDFFGGGGTSKGSMRGHGNTIEMSFVDGSSTSIELPISRDLLDKIVKLAYELKEDKA